MTFCRCERAFPIDDPPDVRCHKCGHDVHSSRLVASFSTHVLALKVAQALIDDGSRVGLLCPDSRRFAFRRARGVRS